MGSKNSKKKNKVRDIYDFHEKLGTGNFATVRRCTSKKTKQEFAVKIIKKQNLSKEDNDLLMDEVNILKKIDHPNIVKMYEFYDSKKEFHIVLELLRGGELFDEILKLGKFSEKQASKVVSDVVKSLSYLHNLGIVHRDLKPENLLYEEETIKLTDFGLAKLTKTGLMSTPCGTPGYVAPEILKNQLYGPPVDLWSLGVILYIMLCGFPPFWGDTPQELYAKIKKGQYEFMEPYWLEISDEAKDLVSKLLTVDPHKRITSAQVFEHPWISGGKAKDKDLGKKYKNQLKSFNAKRKLRKAITVVLAINKLARTVANLDLLLDDEKEAE